MYLSVVKQIYWGHLTLKTFPSARPCMWCNCKPINSTISTSISLGEPRVCMPKVDFYHTSYTPLRNGMFVGLERALFLALLAIWCILVLSRICSEPFYINRIIWYIYLCSPTVQVVTRWNIVSFEFVSICKSTMWATFFKFISHPFELTYHAHAYTTQ